MKARYIPNILSISRMFLGIALLFLGKQKFWFLGCLVCAGITDVLDGILARRFGWTSELGEKLDSAADGVYIVCAILAVIFSIDNLSITLYNYAIFAVLFAGRAANMVITWIKFRKVGFIHTRSSRWASVPIFLLLPVSIFLERVPNQVLAIFLILTALSQFEETWILFAMQKGEYTMSIKSYWEWKRDKAREAALEKQEATV